MRDPSGSGVPDPPAREGRTSPRAPIDAVHGGARPLRVSVQVRRRGTRSRAPFGAARARHAAPRHTDAAPCWSRPGAKVPCRRNPGRGRPGRVGVGRARPDPARQGRGMRHVDAPPTRPIPCTWPRHPSMCPTRPGGPPRHAARPGRGTPRPYTGSGAPPAIPGQAPGHRAVATAPCRPVGVTRARPDPARQGRSPLVCPHDDATVPPRQPAGLRRRHTRSTTSPRRRCVHRPRCAPSHAARHGVCSLAEYATGV